MSRCVINCHIVIFNSKLVPFQRIGFLLIFMGAIPVCLRSCGLWYLCLTNVRQNGSNFSQYVPLSQHGQDFANKVFGNFYILSNRVVQLISMHTTQYSFIDLASYFIWKNINSVLFDENWLWRTNNSDQN